MERQYGEQELMRRESLQKLRELGIDPYPAAEYPVTSDSEDIREQFDEAAEPREVCIAGRLMSRRIMGKASFAELQDSKGRIQIYVTRDDLSEGEDPTMYNVVFKKLLDIGDIIGVEGFVFRTRMGEISVHVKRMTLLSKSLRPLPVVKQKDGATYDAFTDPEQRYRMRYVDLIVNPQNREIFVKRARMYSAFRSFFDSRGFLEVETPILQTIPGGASARPFITHHNALDIPLYLRIADELYLKRLIVGGYDAVYEFGKNFRNEGMDRSHNPEFTGMEVYVAYKDYEWMMAMTEQLLEYTALQVNGKTTVTVDGKEIDLKAPYHRITMTDAIKQYGGYDISGKTEAELRAKCRELGIEVDDSFGKGKLVDELFGATCEKELIQPTFVIDYPVEMSPLTKMHRSKPGLTERFELMINGSELANAYSELNDPIDQLERFEEQMRLSERGDDEAMFIDQDFVRALEYGMPPTSGLGIGMDRLAMLLTEQDTIQEVLLFPTMKPIGTQAKEGEEPTEEE